MYFSVKKTVLTLAAFVFMVSPALSADSMKPGKGITLKPARATWDTGYFQEALVRKGMEELGYKVNKARDLANPIFYQAVALGDLDYWTNGWFPLHNSHLPKNFYDSARKVGYVVKAGGLQGYLVSRKHAEELNIKSLDDFRREDVKKVFDANGDGKADLVACPPGWGCEKIISHHFKVYDLKEHINPIKAAYEASMAEALARYKTGKAVFYYTWAPCWTMYKLKPGKDVVWINVPEINPKEGQAEAIDRMTASGVKGAVTDPVKLGFVVADIQAVANKKFLEKNPAAARFLELFTLPLEDINEQSTKMNEGEKTEKDIARHADEWIRKNQKTWDGWLAEARKAAQ